MIAQEALLENPFSEAQMKFDEIIHWLSAPESHQLSHSEVEVHLKEEGKELLRRMLQAHLDARGLGYVGDAVQGGDGIQRTHKRERSRELMSIFGSVSVNRLAYSARGQDSIHPKDAKLNLPEDLYSHTVRKYVAREAAKNSFDDVTSTIQEYTGAHVPKRQAEELVKRAATDFDEFYDTRRCSEKDATKETGPILVLTTDSKGVVMLPEDLREQTRKAAKIAERKLDKRLCKGEKRNRKRMATVASVYTIEPHKRSAQEIVEELGPVREVSKSKRPKPEKKRVWASIEKPREEVISEVFEEAHRRDPGGEKWAVAVVDGDLKQSELILAEALRRGIKLTLILDIIHALEYLWKASYVFYTEGSREAEQWVSEHLLAILQGRVSLVAAGIRRTATRRQIPQEKRKAADKCADYFLAHKEMMHYDEYLAKGLPIASGVIEGACRHLVKDRMERTGARWSLEGAEAILQMRAVLVSGDFEEYWEFHQRNEYERNHAFHFGQELHHEGNVDDQRERGHLHLVK